MSSPSDASNERALFRRLADGDLSAEEFRALEERLLEDPAFRGRYVRHMGLEADLYEALAETPRSAPAPAPPSRSLRRRFAYAAAACGAAAIALAAAALLRPAPAERPTGYVEAQLRGLREVAVITRAEGLPPEALASLKPGMRVKPGTLALGQGHVQLDFFNGAQLVLEGPSELHILSSEAATLVAGRAAARVPESARGFVLNAPDAAVVDLGTEFALAVNDGRSEVHVVDGEVEVSLLGDDGNTLISERFGEDKTVRFGGESPALVSVEAPTAAPPKVQDLPTTPLLVSDEYVRAVLESGPSVYWRFESADAGVIPNEAGAGHGARIVGADDSPVIAVEGGALRFKSSDTPRYLESVGPIPLLNVGSFSMEFWINPDKLQYSTVVSVIPEGEVWTDFHLNVIEIVDSTSHLVHPPMTFRFLHRHPPSRGGGVNLFSSLGYTPGQWQHVVTVKTPHELSLYIDGRLMRRIEGKAGSDDLSYRLLLGELRDHTTERQFEGRLDEFAVYPRALSDEEVERHYRAVAGLRTEI